MKPKRKHSLSGFMLVDAMVYIAILGIILALAYEGFYTALTNARRLNRYTSDIAHALRVGEQWRAELRGCSAEPRFEQSPDNTILVLPHKSGEICYTFWKNALFRLPPGQSNWVSVVPNVQKSTMLRDQRDKIPTWRWELELKAHHNNPKIKPLFTFEAVSLIEANQ
jgi:Tfp pilus assembly protein PilE